MIAEMLRGECRDRTRKSFSPIDLKLFYFIFLILASHLLISNYFILFYYFILLSFVSSGLYLWHMEVPRIEV